MSLINQMLRDLDARRGPASSTETAALQGLGLADGHAGKPHAMLQRAGLAVGLILAGVLLQQSYRLWAEHQAGQDQVAVAVSARTEIPLPADKPDPVTTAAIPAAQLAENTIAPPSPDDKSDHNVEAAVPVTEEPPHSIPVKKKRVHIIKKTSTPEQKAQHRFSRAQGLLASGQVRDAAKELRAVLELDPGLGEARVQLTMLYLGQGRIERAKQLLETGYRINPADSNIADVYIRFLTEQGEYDRALELMNGQLRQNPANAETLALAAALQYRMQNFDASASYYRQALAIKPGEALWWMGLGVSLDQDRQAAEALSAYRRSNTPVLDTNLKRFVTGRITALSGTTE